MYRIVLTCSGVPIDEGAEAASDITNGFRVHRAWHNNVSCQWDGAQLILQAENDFDSQGLALQDEFSDCLSAYIVKPFDGQICIHSMVKTGGT